MVFQSYPLMKITMHFLLHKYKPLLQNEYKDQNHSQNYKRFFQVVFYHRLHLWLFREFTIRYKTLLLHIYNQL